MKKKLMMVAVFLGALSLGACVDNNESASVEAVRNAKAKQLESVAALNNAKAEAELIRANAEKAMADAKAAYDKALADGKAEETAFAKQKYALKLLQIKAECDAAIAKAKAEMAGYEHAIWDNTDKHVQAVFTAYSGAVGEVNELSGDLIDAKLALAQIDIDAITAEAYLKKYLAEQNELLANAKAEKERLSALKTADKPALLKKMNELSVQAYNLMNTDKPAAEKVADAAEKAYLEVYNPINPYYTEQDDHAADIMLPYVKAWSYLQEVEQYMRGFNIYVSFTATDGKEVEIEDCPNTKWVTTCELSANSSFINATQKVTNQFALLVKNATDNVGVPSVKDESPATGCYIEKERAEAALKKAKADLATEQAKPSNDQDKNLIASLKQTIENETVNVARANETLADAEENLKEKKESQAEFLANLAIVKADSKEKVAYDAAVKASVAAAEKWLVANHAVDRVEAAIDVIGIYYFNGTEVGSCDQMGEYGKVKSLYDGVQDIATLIAQVDVEIAKIEANLKSNGNEAYINKGHGYTLVYNPNTGYYDRVYGEVYVYQSNVSISKEDAKKLAQAEIDAIQKELDVQNALVTKYKAQLDALLAAK